MTDLEKEQLSLMADEIGKMAKELRSIKKWLLEIKDRKTEPPGDILIPPHHTGISPPIKPIKQTERSE